MTPATPEQAALLADFGKQISIADLAFDRSGVCWLAFDEQKVSLRAQPARDEIVIESLVSVLPDGAPRNLLMQVLASNHVAAASGSGTIGLDVESGGLMWVDRVASRGLTQAQFQAALETSFERIAFWRRRLDELVIGHERPDDDEAMGAFAPTPETQVGDTFSVHHHQMIRL